MGLEFTVKTPPSPVDREIHTLAVLVLRLPRPYDLPRLSTRGSLEGVKVWCKKAKRRGIRRQLIQQNVRDKKCLVLFRSGWDGRAVILKNNKIKIEKRRKKLDPWEGLVLFWCGQGATTGERKQEESMSDDELLV